MRDAPTAVVATNRHEPIDSRPVVPWRTLRMARCPGGAREKLVVSSDSNRSWRWWYGSARGLYRVSMLTY